MRIVVLLAFLAAGCASMDKAMDKSADFDRHRYSRLVQPFDHPDRIFFDVSFSPDFPQDNPAADAARMEWLEAWLRQRRLCSAGYEVSNRRPFDYLEDNPGGYRQRWEIRCVVNPGG